MKKPEKQGEIKRRPDGTYEKGVSGNPAGRPPGKSLKEFWKERFAAMTDEEKAEAIKAAVSSLDKAVDAHWTKAGLPDVMAVKEIVGFDVTRKDIEAVASGFLRPAE